MHITLKYLWVPVIIAICTMACQNNTSMPSEPTNTTVAATTANDWCAGHDVPESACTICNPELIDRFVAAGDWCAEHQLPESVCPLCGHGVEEPTQSSVSIQAGTLVRLARPDLEDSVGIATERATDGTLAGEIRCTARITFDRNRMAEVRAPVAGMVRDVLVDLGEYVQNNQPILILESPDVAHLQGELRAARERTRVARSDQQRQAELHRLGIVSVRHLDVAREHLEAAEADAAAARSALAVAGGVEGDDRGRCVLRAPIAGTVVERPAVLGGLAKNDTNLATIADTNHMWALLDVPEAHAGALQTGQAVLLVVDGIEEPIMGRLSWVAAAIDSHTRTVAARAELTNDSGSLRAEQFARATVIIDNSEIGVAVPRAAVQEVDSQSVVFVRLERGLYEPRQVVTGHSSDTLVAVNGQLTAGESVVTTGSYLLKTELERDDIGAGCCEITPPTGA